MSQKIHDLKIWPKYFDPVLSGIKTYEVRKNDRDFRFGDRLVLKEWDPERPPIIADDSIQYSEPIGYTGRTAVFDIGYIFPIPDTDMVVLSLLKVASGIGE